MNGSQLISIATATVLLFANVTLGGEIKDERLARLKSYGFLITSGGIGDTDTRIVVPYGSTAGEREIHDLLNYCAKCSPKSEIVFFGPVIVEEQFRQFSQALPQSIPRHMAAVGLNIVCAVPDGEKERRVLQITGVGSSAKEIGLRVGDMILGIGDYRWPEADSRDSFSYAMRRQLPGEKSNIVVKREGRIFSLPVTWRESIPSINHTTKADNQAVNRSRR